MRVTIKLLDTYLRITVEDKDGNRDEDIISKQELIEWLKERS